MSVKRPKMPGHGGARLQSQHLGGRGRRISEFEPAWSTKWVPGQDSQGYTEKPCLKKPKTNKQKKDPRCLWPLVLSQIWVGYLGSYPPTLSPKWYDHLHFLLLVHKNTISTTMSGETECVVHVFYRWAHPEPLKANGCAYRTSFCNCMLFSVVVPS